MFPRLRQQLGTGILARLDVLVELSTLGEYGVSDDGRAVVLDELSALAPAVAPERRPARTRDACGGRASEGSLVATRRRGAPPARS